ncbi:vWA domain-containing protein [Helicobacter trogontum]|uniref:VWA domain-containing protein n=1 Tax=Helicobacter trogontum TaxID=50960 RepID=A0A4V6HZK0_9HELI|nr:VWA domain-containing protein [Helicobacter trogontum]TLD84772.1 VWA domain-containing protein [Helicobacter trogontum]
MSDLNDEIIEDELADNPTKRVPVCLCLDTSGSMDGSPIMQLNEGVKLFYKAINDDVVAKQSADVCIVTFGFNGVQCNQEFQSIAEEIPPSFSAGGNTPMGSAVARALDLLEDRKRQYQDNGVEYFQPWLVLITDGAPTDAYIDAAQRTSDLVNNKKLTVFAIGVDGCNLEVLNHFSPKRKPMKLNGLNFKEFFQWLSQSVAITSHSKIDEKISLPDTSGWGTL